MNKGSVRVASETPSYALRLQMGWGAHGNRGVVRR
jgi:hypothetical protein